MSPQPNLIRQSNVPGIAIGDVQDTHPRPGSGNPPSAIPSLAAFNRFLKNPSSYARTLALPTALGQSAVQSISLGAATGGHWTITLPAGLGGGTTAALTGGNAGTNGIQVEQAINAVLTNANQSIEVEGPAGGPYRLKTRYNMADPGLVTVNNVSLTGAPAIAVAAIQLGSAGGPTFVRGADNGGSQIAGSALIPYTDQRFRITGQLTSTSIIANRLCVIDPNPLTSSAGWAGTQRIEFETEASEFEIDMIGAANDVAIRVWVNGQPHAPQPMRMPFPIVGNPVKWLVNFGSRARRQIIIESEGGMQFAGIWVAKTDTIWNPSYPLGPRVMWIGASGEWGGGSGTVMGAFPYDACRLMGWGDIWVEAVPGSGWVVATDPPEGNAGTTFLNRVADAQAIAPDILIFGTTVNDEGQPSAAITQAIQAGIAQALQLPKTPWLIVLGPTRMNAPIPADFTVNQLAIAAAASMGITTTPNQIGVYIDLCAGATGALCPGTGNLGGLIRYPGNPLDFDYAAPTPKGDGPADNYSWDTVHASYVVTAGVWDGGGPYAARRIAAEFQRVGAANP